jgi:hypothetical protein
VLFVLVGVNGVLLGWLRGAGRAVACPVVPGGARAWRLAVKGAA